MSTQTLRLRLTRDICFLLLLSCKDSFCILHTSPLSDIWFVNIFSHSVNFLFTLLILSFDSLKTHEFLIDLFFSFVIWVFEGPCIEIIAKNICIYFLWRVILVLALTCRSLINFELVFVYSVILRSHLIIYTWISVCPNTTFWFMCGAGKRMGSLLARWRVMRASQGLLPVLSSPSLMQRRGGLSPTWSNYRCLKLQKRMRQGQIQSSFKILIICSLWIFTLIIICPKLH